LPQYCLSIEPETLSYQSGAEFHASEFILTVILAWEGTITSAFSHGLTQGKTHLVIVTVNGLVKHSYG